MLAKATKRTPGQITRDEARYLFLRHVADLVDYWSDENRVCDPREKLEGLAFSILTALDGCSAGLPGYAVVPMQTPDDEKWLRTEGIDYYPTFNETQLPEGVYDIGGGMHDVFYGYRSGNVQRPKNLHDFGAHLLESAKQNGAAP